MGSFGNGVNVFCKLSLALELEERVAATNRIVVWLNILLQAQYLLSFLVYVIFMNEAIDI